MPSNRVRISVLALAAALVAIALPPVQPAASAAPAARQERALEAFAQTKGRPRVIIHPRHLRLGPNAKRICQAWLAQEFRSSGTVLTPQMRCWWEQ